MKPFNGPEEESDVLALSLLETRLFSDWRIAPLNVLYTRVPQAQRELEICSHPYCWFLKVKLKHNRLTQR